MKLNSVGILVTYRCPIRCDHCYINCGPHRTEVIDLDLAERLLRQVREVGLTGSHVHLGGGEAFVVFKRIVEVLEIADRLDMTPVDWVETNCFWCTSDGIVRQRLTTLKEAGLKRMWLSTDPYHQEHVPLENVRRARDIGVDIFGEDNVVTSQHEYFERPEQWPDVAAYVNAFPPMLMGRAYECLRQHLPRRPLSEFTEEQCANCIDPTEMTFDHINPDGTVMATNCSGVIIGDARETTLAQLHSDPDWRQNDILRSLADHGPMGLLDMAPEFEPRETYAQKCELCWEVRSHLAPSYPEALAPPECYTDPHGSSG